MGNNAAKEKALQIQSQLSEDEKKGLNHTFNSIRSPTGFNERFQLERLQLAQENLKEKLLSNLPNLVTSLKSSNDCILFDSIVQYQILFHKITKEMSTSARINFYWSLFPSFKSFFSAAYILSRKDTSNSILSDEEIKLISSFVDWIERESETFSSQLIMADDSAKSLTLLQLFLVKRTPRILIYFDMWIYETFTNIQLPHGKIFFFDPDDNRKLAPLNNFEILWGLSMLLPPQILYISEFQSEIVVNKSIDIFSKLNTNIHSLVWDLIYDTDRDGSGINRLHEATWGYASSSLLLLETKNGEIFGAYIPIPWPRYEKQFFGDERCFIISILPNFTPYPTLGMSKNYIRFMDKERRNDSNLGIGFGGQREHERLWINGDDNFTTGRKMEMCSTYLKGFIGNEETEFEITRLQIWGFGAQSALDFRKEVRLREDKFTERSKKLDPAAFFAKGQSITENPDKMMMDWLSTKRQQ